MQLFEVQFSLKSWTFTLVVRTDGRGARMGNGGEMQRCNTLNVRKELGTVGGRRVRAGNGSMWVQYQRKTRGEPPISSTNASLVTLSLEMSKRNQETDR